MRHIGIVMSFDHAKGSGVIQPENGGGMLRFVRSGIYRDQRVRPVAGQRLTYELSDTGGEVSALNLQNVRSHMPNDTGPSSNRLGDRMSRIQRCDAAFDELCEQRDDVAIQVSLASEAQPADLVRLSTLEARMKALDRQISNYRPAEALGSQSYWLERSDRHRSR